MFLKVTNNDQSIHYIYQCVSRQHKKDDSKWESDLYYFFLLIFLHHPLLELIENRWMLLREKTIRKTIILERGDLFSNHSVILEQIMQNIIIHLPWWWRIIYQEHFSNCSDLDRVVNNNQKWFDEQQFCPNNERKWFFSQINTRKSWR